MWIFPIKNYVAVIATSTIHMRNTQPRYATRETIENGVHKTYFRLSSTLGTHAEKTLHTRYI